MLQKKGDEGPLVDLAVEAIEMLAQLGNATADRAASASSGAEADAGQGLGSGEVPAAQAAVLYVLRVGVIEQMGETGQVCITSLSPEGLLVYAESVDISILIIIVQQSRSHRHCPGEGVYCPNVRGHIRHTQGILYWIRPAYAMRERCLCCSY